MYRKVIFIGLLVISVVATVIGVSTYRYNHSLDQYYQMGDLEAVDCPDKGEFEAQGGQVSFLCNREVFYVEEMKSATYEDFIHVKVDLEKESRHLTIVKMYMGNGEWRLVEIWYTDWKLLEGGCWFTRMEECSNHFLIWSRFAKHFRFELGDAVYALPSLEATTGGAKAGEEAMVLEIEGKVLYVRFTTDGREGYFDYRWFTSKKP